MNGVDGQLDDLNGESRLNWREGEREGGREVEGG